MERIVPTTEHRVFAFNEAQSLVPILLKLTQMSQSKVNELIHQREVYQITQPEKAKEIEEQINKEVDKWHGKLRRLGVIPKGVWLADFDNGEGYYCWKYPEIRIKFFHGYKDGFTGRKAIQ